MTIMVKAAKIELSGFADIATRNIDGRGQTSYRLQGKDGLVITVTPGIGLAAVVDVFNDVFNDPTRGTYASLFLTEADLRALLAALTGEQ